MDKKIEEFQTASSELCSRVEDLVTWLPAILTKHMERLISKVTYHSKEVKQLSEAMKDYAPRHDSCRCAELEEILELIPKELSLGEFLDFYDLVANHFQKSTPAPFPRTGSKG